jgi:hypothetical protein
MSRPLDQAWRDFRLRAACLRLRWALRVAIHGEYSARADEPELDRRRRFHKLDLLLERLQPGEHTLAAQEEWEQLVALYEALKKLAVASPTTPIVPTLRPGLRRRLAAKLMPRERPETHEETVTRAIAAARRFDQVASIMNDCVDEVDRSVQERVRRLGY